MIRKLASLALSLLTGSLWRWLLADLWRVAFALSLAFAGIQTLRIEGVLISPQAGPFHFTLIDWPGFVRQLADASATIAAHDRQIGDMVKAGRTARYDQIIVNQRPAAISAAIAKASEHDAQAYYDAGHRAGAAYAAIHPVRLRGTTAPTSGGERGATDLPRADHAPPLNDRPGNPATGVTLSRADFDQLVANSLRLAKVHQDAEALIKAGAANSEY